MHDDDFWYVRSQGKNTLVHSGHEYKEPEFSCCRGSEVSKAEEDFIEMCIECGVDTSRTAKLVEKRFGTRFLPQTIHLLEQTLVNRMENLSLDATSVESLIQFLDK